MKKHEDHWRALKNVFGQAIVLRGVSDELLASMKSERAHLAARLLALVEAHAAWAALPGSHPDTPVLEIYPPRSGCEEWEIGEGSFAHECFFTDHLGGVDGKTLAEVVEVALAAAKKPENKT